LIWFIITIVIAVIGIIALAIGRLDDGRDTISLRPVGLGALAVAVVMLIFNIFTIVPTRNIGITIAFGKPTGTLSNGFHLVAPWESVETYDATIQTLVMSGTDETPTLWVRIANGAMAQMEVSVDWQIDPNADIQQLHLDWRNFEAIQDRVIKPRLSDAMNKAFENYDPLVAFKQAGGQPTSLSTMETAVKDRLQGLVPAGIVIKRLAIPLPIFPKQVQEALDNMQKELAATQVALQQKITAQAQKEAIDILAQAKMSPEAFAQQCLIVTERLAQQGKGLPAAWSCTVAPTAVVPVR
jgi:regulator of protease activity HflC (stomatin/prohibitin superfamily)